MAATAKQNAMIALLTVSAILMAVVLIVLPAHPPRARAAVTASAGNYTIATIPNSMGGDESVAVVDQQTQRMVIYMIQQNRLLLIGAQDLKAGFKVAPAPRVPGAATPEAMPKRTTMPNRR